MSYSSTFTFPFPRTTSTMPSNALFVLYFAQLDDKISGRIFADNLNNPLSYIMRWYWNFSLQKSVVERPTQTWRANELPFAYPCKKRRKDSKAYFTLIGQKNTKIFWHQLEARMIATVWNWPDKTWDRLTAPGSPWMVQLFQGSYSWKSMHHNNHSEALSICNHYCIDFVRIAASSNSGFQEMIQGIDGPRYYQDLLRFSATNTTSPWPLSRTSKKKKSETEQMFCGNFLSIVLFNHGKQSTIT